MSPIVLLALAALVAPSCAFGQVRAHTQPLSADRIVLEIHVEGETPATVHVRNGQMARVQVAGEPSLGMTPIIKDGKIDLVLLEVSRDATTGNEGLRQLARYELTLASVTRLDVPGAAAIEVAWLATLPPAVGLSAELGPCSECCVWCGTVLFCGCVVITECGRCCCPTACECPFPPEGNGCNTGGCAQESARPVLRDRRLRARQPL